MWLSNSDSSECMTNDLVKCFQSRLSKLEIIFEPSLTKKMFISHEFVAFQRLYTTKISKRRFY